MKYLTARQGMVSVHDDETTRADHFSEQEAIRRILDHADLVAALEQTEQVLARWLEVMGPADRAISGQATICRSLLKPIRAALARARGK